MQDDRSCQVFFNRCCRVDRYPAPFLSDRAVKPTNRTNTTGSHTRMLAIRRGFVVLDVGSSATTMDEDSSRFELHAAASSPSPHVAILFPFLLWSAWHARACRPSTNLEQSIIIVLLSLLQQVKEQAVAKSAPSLEQRRQRFALGSCARTLLSAMDRCPFCWVRL